MQKRVFLVLLSAFFCALSAAASAAAKLPARVVAGGPVTHVSYPAEGVLVSLGGILPLASPEDHVPVGGQMYARLGGGDAILGKKNEKGLLCEHSIKESACQVVKNLERLLEAQGLDKENIVKITVYIGNKAKNNSTFLDILKEYFKANLPPIKLYEVGDRNPLRAAIKLDVQVVKIPEVCGLARRVIIPEVLPSERETFSGVKKGTALILESFNKALRLAGLKPEEVTQVAVLSKVADSTYLLSQLRAFLGAKTAIIMRASAPHDPLIKLEDVEGIEIPEETGSPQLPGVVLLIQEGDNRWGKPVRAVGGKRYSARTVETENNIKWSYPYDEEAKIRALIKYQEDMAAWKAVQDAAVDDATTIAPGSPVAHPPVADDVSPCLPTYAGSDEDGDSSGTDEVPPPFALDAAAGATGVSDEGDDASQVSMALAPPAEASESEDVSVHEVKLALDALKSDLERSGLPDATAAIVALRADIDRSSAEMLNPNRVALDIIQSMVAVGGKLYLTGTAFTGSASETAELAETLGYEVFDPAAAAPAPEPEVRELADDEMMVDGVIVKKQKMSAHVAAFVVTDEAVAAPGVHQAVVGGGARPRAVSPPRPAAGGAGGGTSTARGVSQLAAAARGRRSTMMTSAGGVVAVRR